MGCLKLTYYQTDFKVENYFKKELTSNFSEINARSSYEMTSHTSNVLVTLSDRKFPTKTTGSTYDFYEPNVLSYSDYYPGHFLLPNRHSNPGSYRYGGANGQESDAEITGSFGSHYTAEHWMFDSRLVRRWENDPVVKPWESPYAAFSNNPIFMIDPNGDNADGYTVDKKGNIERVDDTGGDKYDVLYTKSDYEKAKKSGKTNQFGNPEPTKQLKVDNTELLSSLSTTDPKFQQKDYHGFHTYKETYNKKTKEIERKYNIQMLQGHYGFSDNEWEIKRVFKFVASNSDVEWAIEGNKSGKWAIGTLHENSQAPSFDYYIGKRKDGYPMFKVMDGFEIKSVLYRAHSHPGNGPDSFVPSNNDISNAQTLKEASPRAKVWIFMPEHPKQKWFEIK